MTRPDCPACGGSQVMGNKHPRPCTCCDDGTMRGIDDPTAEERRIDVMRQALTWIADATLSQMTREQMQNTAAEALRRADRAGGGR